MASFTNMTPAPAIARNFSEKEASSHTDPVWIRPTGESIPISSMSGTELSRTVQLLLRAAPLLRTRLLRQLRSLTTLHSDTLEDAGREIGKLSDVQFLLHFVNGFEKMVAELRSREESSSIS